jgi:hypothetical protein
MTQAYFDASYLAKLHWKEVGSAEVVKLASRIGVVGCSIHGRTEFAAVGHRKMREKLADPERARAVFQQMEDPGRSPAMAGTRPSVLSAGGANLPLRSGNLLPPRGRRPASRLRGRARIHRSVFERPSLARRGSALWLARDRRDWCDLTCSALTHPPARSSPAGCSSS